MSNNIVKYSEDKLSIIDFTKINYGEYGIVFRATCDSLGIVAYKQFKSDNKDDNEKEISMLICHSSHPNIVQIFGAVVDSQGEYVGFVMENMELGSLERIIHSDMEYKYSHIYLWITKVCKAIEFLHSRGILHRDIKPSNMVLGHSLYDIKLCDFGLAKATDTTLLTAGRGTIIYMAPEVDIGHEYGKPADIYSLDISIWQMFHRKLPYYHLSSSGFDKMKMIRDGERPIIDDKIPLKIRTLLEKGWLGDPNERATLTDFLEVVIESEGLGGDDLQCIYDKENSEITNNEEERTTPVENLVKNTQKFPLYQLQFDQIAFNRIFSYTPNEKREENIEFLRNVIRCCLSSPSNESIYIIKSDLSEDNCKTVHNWMISTYPTDGLSLYEIPLAGEDIFILSYKPKIDDEKVIEIAKKKLQNLLNFKFMPEIEKFIPLKEEDQLGSGKRIKINLIPVNDDKNITSFLQVAIQLYTEKVLRRKKICETIRVRGIEAVFTVMDNLNKVQNFEEQSVKCLFISHDQEILNCLEQYIEESVIIGYSRRNSFGKMQAWNNLTNSLKIDKSKPNNYLFTPEHWLFEFKNHPEKITAKTNVIKECLNAAMKFAYSSLI